MFQEMFVEKKIKKVKKVLAIYIFVFYNPFC